jgi:very-short-patch-repair endonuclease
LRAACRHAPAIRSPDLRIAIEHDGDIHRTDRRIWRRDIARRRSLEALGWRVITWTADDTRDPASVIAAVRAARDRGPRAAIARLQAS